MKSRKPAPPRDQTLPSHYGRLLGLNPPWEVDEVRLELEDRTVLISLRHGDGPFHCPKCEAAFPIHDHGAQRQWRHLDTMQFMTYLEARLPRVDCPKHGVLTVEAPWAEPNGRFTLMFEAAVLFVARSCSSIQAVCEWTRLSWTTVHDILERGVERGLKRRDLSGVSQVGLDEKSFLRGQSYVTIASDLAKRCVVEVTRGRDEQAATAALAAIPAQVRDAVSAVALDLSPAYVAAAGDMLPNASLVFDRYHASALLNGAVETVRRAEHRRLGGPAKGSVLTNSRYQWIRAPENMEAEELDKLEKLSRMNLQTARAWRHKENFVEFWTMPNVDQGRAFFKRWYAAAIRSRLEPVKQVARTFKKHLDKLLAFLIHRITNALAEALNGLVQTIKTNARGFRNFSHYRVRILFHLGKLEMSPLATH